MHFILEDLLNWELRFLLAELLALNAAPQESSWLANLDPDFCWFRAVPP
jgi:hypothetical protein